MDQINFYAGETKQITVFVRPSRNVHEIVVVTRAEYQLTKQYEKDVIEKGSCEINGNEVSVMLGIEESGMYELKVTMQVGRETRIKKSLIRVD
ncbi:MAG: hypothetical protein NC122_06375 [Faecalibacterium sp.]|nr:hypothetical protein [Ruminococcus sp.]MCM1392120.1 hypothetical protein [Ruminococcus sp.]MCM1485817.1 hypothetical protein [Faecalibacterium sp.]